MKKTLLALVIIISSILLVSCGCQKLDDENTGLISSDQTECSKILFTCPQYETPFYNDSECGCVKNENQTVDDPSSRELGKLISSYLAGKIFTPENEGGVVISEFATLDQEELDEGAELKYEVWAEIREYYYNDKDERTFTLRHRGPVILDITQTGRSYIVHGFKTLNFDDKELVKKELTEKSFALISNEETLANMTKGIDQYIQQTADGTLINGRIRVKLN